MFVRVVNTTEFDEPTTKAPLWQPITADTDAGAQWQTLCILDFRGLEPVSFDPSVCHPPPPLFSEFQLNISPPSFSHLRVLQRGATWFGLWFTNSLYMPFSPFFVWMLQGAWTCKGLESGTKFEGVEFDDGVEWMDYDEKVSSTLFFRMEEVPVPVADTSTRTHVFTFFFVCLATWSIA